LNAYVEWTVNSPYYSTDAETVLLKLYSLL